MTFGIEDNELRKVYSHSIPVLQNVEEVVTNVTAGGQQRRTKLSDELATESNIKTVVITRKTLNFMFI